MSNPYEDRLALHLWEARERNALANLPALDEAELSGYQEAAKVMISRMESAFAFILSHPNPRTAEWMVAYAFGLKVCNGVSMEQRSQQLGLKKQTISKGAREFQRGNRLPLSPYMRDSAGACQEAREKQLTVPPIEPEDYDHPDSHQ